MEISSFQKVFKDRTNIKPETALSLEIKCQSLKNPHIVNKNKKLIPYSEYQNYRFQNIKPILHILPISNRIGSPA